MASRTAPRPGEPGVRLPAIYIAAPPDDLQVVERFRVATTLCGQGSYGRTLALALDALDRERTASGLPTSAAAVNPVHPLDRGDRGAR